MSESAGDFKAGRIKIHCGIITTPHNPALQGEPMPDLRKIVAECALPSAGECGRCGPDGWRWDWNGVRYVAVQCCKDKDLGFTAASLKKT